jgi:hypothetical protein
MNANEPFLPIDRRNQAVGRCVRAALNAKLRHGRLPVWQGLAQGITSVMHATFSRVHFRRHESVTFSSTSV